MTDTEITRLPDGSYVDGNGEILDIPEGVNPLTYAAHQRHHADREIKQWTAERARWDAFLISQQGARKSVYDDVTISVAMPTRSTLDVDAFIASVEARRLEPDDLLAVLAAAKGFDKAKLPESVQGLYESHVMVSEGKPYVRSTPTRPRAARPW